MGRRMVGVIASNWDHVIHERLAERLKQVPKLLYAIHPAANFLGEVWFDGENYCEEIWRDGGSVGTMTAPDYKTLFLAVNERYGSE